MSRRRTINLTLLALVAGLLIAGLLLVYQTIQSERAEREQVSQTNEILLELRNVSRAVINAETGQRGYLITLDRSYLQPYQAGRERVPASMRRLRELVEPVATERQTILLDRIDTLATAKLDELDGSVELLSQGRLLDARRKVLTDEGQNLMQQLRAAISEMETIETRILVDSVGDTARSEGRVLPLLIGLILLQLIAIAFGYRLITRAAQAEVRAAQASALAEARDRADLLAKELNHRVKNLFAVILAIVQMSARDAPEAKPVTNSISERIRALLTAHEVTQGSLDKPVALLSSLVDTTIAPYLSKERAAITDGPEVVLPAKQVTPLGLVLHELATNAVKYGCWAQGGELEVRWQRADGQITIRWDEHFPGSADEPERVGFGSLLMKGSAQQLGGTIDRKFTPDGVRVVITMKDEEAGDYVPAPIE
ncbi:hypothetical protein HME9302_02161 [Alteripontixanthobacter maritimus]|uniref:histidine kinase n=1 Tax=Alteripontixanthobacter maritimus TaxID=2161824 RepID=A0A369Q8A7_9SPHN|nr:CHASE3 domain-containing protein [Alteripontixanthobacter maritimus]RDC60944.1 hypothetical protein HME9302_02161 [Alteripontixanthobacter maritimus]